MTLSLRRRNQPEDSIIEVELHDEKEDDHEISKEQGKIFPF